MNNANNGSGRYAALGEVDAGGQHRAKESVATVSGYKIGPMTGNASVVAFVLVAQVLLALRQLPGTIAGGEGILSGYGASRSVSYTG